LRLYKAKIKVKINMQESQLNFKIVRLGKDTSPTHLQQFVAMMQRMYEFHATLHSDWQPREGWQEGSAGWIKRAGDNEDWFFAIVLTADEQASPAGYVTASFHYEAPLFVQNRFGYIADMWVEEAFRRQGVATQTLDAVYAWFREQGVNRVQLEVDVENLGGQEFWRSVGYSDFEIVMRRDI
jgi:ribosomal protein S18 acetylase RimI-like enzyme